MRHAEIPVPQPALTVLRARSVGVAANERLRKSERGVVEGAFDGAVNVRLERGMVCVVPEAVGMGPLNVVVRLPGSARGMAPLGLRIGDTVSVRNSCIVLGGRLQVDLRSARLYSPDLEGAALPDGDVLTNLEVARRTALRLGSLGGLGSLLGLLGTGASGSTTRLNIFASAAVAPILALGSAFLSQDGDLMSRAVGDLVGLGPGLTPSADDALAGLALLCVLYSRCGRAPAAGELVSRAIEAQPPGRTTRLSEEFLAQAALGNGNEAAVRLCRAILTNSDEVEEATRAMLSVGETSGTDTVLGVVLGGMLCLGMPLGLDARGR